MANTMEIEGADYMRLPLMPRRKAPVSREPSEAMLAEMTRTRAWRFRRTYKRVRCRLDRSTVCMFGGDCIECRHKL